jgi:hypothetical protein
MHVYEAEGRVCAEQKLIVPIMLIVLIMLMVFIMFVTRIMLLVLIILRALIMRIELIMLMALIMLIMFITLRVLIMLIGLLYNAYLRVASNTAERYMAEGRVRCWKPLWCNKLVDPANGHVLVPGVKPCMSTRLKAECVPSRSS